MASKLGLGLTLPVNRGSVGYFSIAYDAMTQTKTNLTNLLLTKRGERIMQPKFGTNLHKFVFEQITDDTIANIRGDIVESVQMWMPFVSIDNIQIRRDEDKHNIFLNIVFSLKVGIKQTDAISLVI